MEKYQPVTTENKGLQRVEIIEINIDSMTGKKKIGSIGVGRNDYM